ncbi:MAG: orotidine-5'-phosphate decarboxylase [Bacteroidia bacterium]|nr:orotidine-5'-phosphate decarboxylase [Bacteroidia bacterium]
MLASSLTELIRTRKSYLCVGLDTDPALIPDHLKHEPDPVLAFNRAIIEATAPYAVAYKPNLAFYEALGPSGWETLRKTLEFIPKDILTIADAKRGDIGNTATRYATAFFETLGFDALTVAPYMGVDSVKPFLAFPEKWVFLLALTSNPGSFDFQHHGPEGQPLYQEVLRKSQEWAKDMPGNLGYVVGATRSIAMDEVRAIVPESTLLVPGVGAQGGDLHAVCKHGSTSQGGLLVNSSRGILYAGKGHNFAQAAEEAARSLQQDMAPFVEEIVGK